jgi:predicted dehydrogenase
MSGGLLGVALVGSGAAAAQHAAVLAQLPDAELRAVVDVDAEAAAAFAARHEAPVRAWESVLRDDRVEIVALCTPPGPRPRLALEALAAGKAVLLEKPPTSTLEELEEVVAAARGAGRPAAVMLQHRGRLPEEARRHEWSSGASMGIEVVRFRSPAHYAAQPWRTDPVAAAGGFFAHLVIHYADLACRLFGEPRAVDGAVACDAFDGIDTRLALLVTFDGERHATIYASSRGRLHSQRLTAEDDEVVLELRETETRVQAGEAEGVYPARPPQELRRDVYEELVAATRAGAEDVDTFALAGARGATVVLEAVRRLARTAVGAV